MGPSVGVVLALMAFLAADGDARECASKVHRNLRAELSKIFPSARLPQLKDLDASSVQDDLKRGGDGCFAVTDADFDGDGHADVAMLLSPAVNVAPQLVVAMGRADSWDTRVLPSLCTSVPKCYVGTQRPGIYRRSEALDEVPLKDGERSNITTLNRVLVSGSLDGSAAVYAFTDRGWAFVTVR